MRPKVIVGILVRFVIVYGALMALWPVAADEYGAFFRAGGELIFGSFGSTRTVRFRTLTEPDGTNDTSFRIINRTSGEWTKLNTSSRYMGYFSTGVLAGLVLATPIPWRRRARALLWGLLLLHGFISLRLGILIGYACTLETSGPLVLSQAFWARSLRAAVGFLTIGLAVSYIVPILIWALVSLRREDLAMIIPGQRHRKT